MKKLLLIFIIIFIAWRWGYKLYKRFGSQELSRYEVVFKFYSDLKEEDVDKYFDLPEGTYQQDKHQIVYRSTTANSEEETVPFDISELDCNEKYNKSIHQKTTVSLKAREETAGEEFEIALVEKSGFREFPIGSNMLRINNFRPGKINHVILSINDLKPGILRKKHIVGYTLACGDNM